MVAYRMGDFGRALTEFRTVRRLGGSNHLLPLMVDCERGLGRHERALELAASPEAKTVEAEERMELAIVVAGEDTALASCRPLFEAMGRATFPFGTDAPKANVVKLSGNFLIANVIQSLGEAMALVRKAGIDPDAFLSLLTSTLFGAPVYQGYGGRIAKGNYQAEAGFAMPLALKDMRLAMEAATAQQVPMPTLAVIWQRILAAEARGYGGLDWSALGLLAAEDAGLPDSAPARSQGLPGEAVRRRSGAAARIQRGRREKFERGAGPLSSHCRPRPTINVSRRI